MIKTDNKGAPPDKRVSFLLEDDEENDLVMKLNGLCADLDVSTQARNALKNARVKFIGDLVQMWEGNVRKIPKIGPKRLNEIKEALSMMGLKLGMYLDFPPWNSILTREIEDLNALHALEFLGDLSHFLKSRKNDPVNIINFTVKYRGLPIETNEDEL